MTGAVGTVVTLPGRLVMIADGVGDGLRLPLSLGEIATDHALKLGEFADHPGDEVGFCKPGGAFDLRPRRL